MQTKGYAAAGPKEPLEPFTFERRDPGAHDVVIEVKFCGICHSDIHQARDEWGDAIFPMVPGHEVAGVVSYVGSSVTKFRVGDRVGVGCFVDSCRTCESCREGIEQYCRVHVAFSYNGTEMDRTTPTMGGYSQQMVVDENYVLRIPDALSLDVAAPLLCAGITLYSPLRHWQAGPGKRVAIVGLGGLGHMGVKLAHAFGAEVTVLSETLRKRDDGLRMGADAYFATSDPATFEELRSSFDLIVNTVSAPIDWNAYLGLLRLDGTMVVLGVPERATPIEAFAVIHNRRSLAGSSIGGIRETQEMLDFCAQYGITPEIEVIPIQRVNDAYERVVRGDVRYRFCIDMASLGTHE